MLADVKLVVVRPETVRALDELESPEPSRLLKDWELTIKLVVEALMEDE